MVAKRRRLPLYSGPKQVDATGLREDPVRFAREELGLAVDEVQAKVLRGAKRGILNCSRQWGKTTVLAAMVVHRAVTIPGYRVAVVAPALKQSAELLKKVKEFLGVLGIRGRGDGVHAVSVLLKNGSRIIALPGGGQVRGVSGIHLLVIDEASRVPDDVYDAVRPFLATTDGDLWLMSTPAGQRGFFFQEWEEGGEDWLRVKVTAEECSRISAAFLKKEQRRVGARGYRQEYLCEFLGPKFAFFDAAAIERFFTFDLKPMTPEGRKRCGRK